MSLIAQSHPVRLAGGISLLNSRGAGEMREVWLAQSGETIPVASAAALVCSGCQCRERGGWFLVKSGKNPMQ